MFKFSVFTIGIFLLVVTTEAKIIKPDTQNLIRENHEKVEVNKWISKHLPYINDISKFNDYTVNRNQLLQNPFNTYIAQHNQNTFKANWKVANKSDTINTQTTQPKSVSSKIEKYKKESTSSSQVFSYNSIAHSNRKIDLVLVKKSQHRMELVKDNKVFKTFHIALGKNPIGNKEKIHDNRTPEGKYTLDYKKNNSQYHLAVHISYPNSDDIKRAKLSNVDPGGMIFIHGQPNNIGIQDDENSDGEINFNKFIQPSNWTNGCIALLNSDMYEFYNMVDIGTPIEILP